jgi:hypothetical protein
LKPASIIKEEKEISSLAIMLKITFLLKEKKVVTEIVNKEK